MTHFLRLLLLFLLPIMTTVAMSQEAEDTPTSPVPVFHPLDALTTEEIVAAAKLLRDAGHADDKSLFGAMTLLEPPKDVILSWTSEQPAPPRHAFVVIRRNAKTYEARVDITNSKVLEAKEQPAKHPIVLDDNWTRARDAFMSDPRFKQAVERRGLKLDDKIVCTPNSAGWFPGEDHGGRHIVKVPCYSLSNMLHPSLARPIEGLMGVVDAETGAVLQVYDRQVVPLPPAPAGYGVQLPTYKRAIARVGFGVDGIGNMKLSGNLNVEWLDWRFHVRSDKRAGMVLSLVKFNDGKRWRDIAYQMNVSEMFVPYMDPDALWSYRTFMDAGEFGLGYLLSSLRPGVDCPETAAFIDVTLPNDVGGTYVREQGLCVFERPTGDPAWRHYSPSRKVVDGEPQLELVVRHIPTLGNYDYVVDYVFTPQGQIKLRVGATGFDAIKSVAAKDMEAETASTDTAYGNLIAPYTVAPFHDHYFSFRLDLDVDGQANTLVRDVFVPHAVTNANGRTSLWTVKTQRFVKEGPVVNDHNSMGGKLLRITSPDARNGLKQIPSLWLHGGHDAQSIMTVDDPAQARAKFTSSQFWVTRYKANELWAAGLYPNLNPKDEGLPEFVADSEDVTAQDLVVWYTMGFRHITRPEDFPILPTFWHEMTIRPAFFFDTDPGMTFNSGFRQ